MLAVNGNMTTKSKAVRSSPTGLVTRVEDTGARGREHRIAIDFAVLDRIAESRHGIAQLKQNLLTLKGMLDDISKIAPARHTRWNQRKN